MGTPVVLHGASFVVFAKLRVLMSDGDGIRAGYGWKGASSLKPCLRHLNVWMLGSDMAHRQPEQVEITCSRASCFQSATARDYTEIAEVLKESARSCAEGRMTKARFNNISMTLGFNHVKNGLLSNERLRDAFDAAEVATFGWMHTYLQGGVMSKEAWECVAMLNGEGFDMPSIEAYLKDDWEFPAQSKRDGRQLHTIFNSYRSKSNTEASRLKTNASELLGLYALLRHFKDVNLVDVPDELQPALTSFNSACESLDIILAAKRRRLPMREAAVRLRASAERHMANHLAAYGTEHVTPKFHWQFDIAYQMERDADFEFLPDEFIIERIHLRVKPIAEAHDNTRVYERGVLAGVIASQRRDLQSLEFGDTLRGKLWRMPNAPRVVLSKYLCVNSCMVAAQDIVTNGHSFGVVVACVYEDGLMVVVEELEAVAKVSTYGWRCRNTFNRRVWAAEIITTTVAWKQDGDSLIVLGM